MSRRQKIYTKIKTCQGRPLPQSLYFTGGCPHHFCFTSDGTEEGGMRNTNITPGSKAGVCYFHPFRAPSLFSWQRPLFPKRKPFQEAKVGEFTSTSVTVVGTFSEPVQLLAQPNATQVLIINSKT